MRLRLVLVLGLAYAGVVASFLLPAIALDGSLANLAVLVADSATAHWLPFVALGLVAVLVSRPGLSGRRRGLEAGAAIGIMLVILAGNAALNEFVIKPVFAVPRPNLIALADDGALGLGVDEFYALGDKQARRDYLGPRLDALTEPRLGQRVRGHWLIETGYSFPSGHATASMTFAALMAAAALRWARGWRQAVMLAVPVWAVAVACSRPLLRVHTPIDVSVGAAVGVVLGTLGFVVLHTIVVRFAEQPDSLADNGQRNT